MIDRDTCLAEARAMGETLDCAVRAVAIATQTPYREVHELMRQHGRRYRKRTPNEITGRVLRKLGASILAQDRKAATVATVPRAFPSGSYLISTRGHILACVDGKVQDWTEGRRHRVLSVVRVTMPERAEPAPVVEPAIDDVKASPRSQMWLIAA